ncbi:hypothetical protein LAZ67_8000486 [Cordylochernes scorpioides]|uniref:Reverse transcriptase domain-containing protein n=1 Tax=Cordylochernes scorpioides TaxID=51811 RepID=A0ABY6KPE7_9ARAC|nr:hypothetical protein LAZ67_8000486 [Cordylochernes scorpioides]
MAIGLEAQLSLNAIRRFTNLNPEVIRLLTHLCRKSLQLARWRLHLNFNKICQRARFIPPSLRVADPVGNSHSNRVILRSQRQLLWARTQGCYSRIRCLSKTIKGVISQVTNLISQSNMVELLGLLTADIRQQDSIIKGRQYKKLSFWISKYGFPEEFHPDNQPVPTLLNLSSTVLSPSQTEVLSLGLKYRPPTTPDIPRIISGVEPAISSLSHTAQYDIRSSIAHILRKPTPTQSQSPSQSQSLGKYRSLATLRRNHNIIITRSDKGSQTVVLDTADYASKMTEILSDRNTFVPITQPDASTSTKSFRLGLLRLKKSGHITPDQYSTFTSDLNNTPYIYGLPKTHKPDIPLRPIIAYHLSPAYKLSKYLTGLLTPWVKAIPQSSAIRDIPSFVQSINSLCPVPNTVMVSYDVVAMYLSLPHQLIIRHLTSFLQDNQVDHRTAESIVALSSLCLDFTTFTFNNQLFKQIRGSPMGSPLSSPLAEIVMANIDHWVQQQIAPGIHMWRRYIDDIFCICDTGQEINILNSLNSYHPEISFTLELENRSVLPYLDILVIRTASHYHTTVYHKVNNPTFYTDYKSSCPLSHKINTVRTLTKRLFTHCSLPLFRTIEFSLIIKQLARSQYPPHFIHKYKFDPSSVRPPAITRNSCILPFSTQSVAISRILRTHGINTHFTNSNSIGAILRHPITRLPRSTVARSSGGSVYSVSCNDCSASYIGETVDQKYAMYSVGRRTKRWPLCLFFSFLDVVAINSAVIYKAVKQDGGMAQKDFKKQLALQLMRDALNMRNQAKNLSRDLQVLIQKHAGTSSLERVSTFVIKTGSTTQWQADLAPKEMAASDMRNRRHVQPLLTWSTNTADPRAVIKFNAKLGRSASETYILMKQVYGTLCLSKSNVFIWHKRFSNGRNTLEDEDKHTGRPSSSETPESIEKVLHINKETIRTILHEDLGKTKVCAKFVPHTLTGEQKSLRIALCRDIISAYENDSNFLKSIVTGDETWCFQYDPKTKRQSAEWK